MGRGEERRWWQPGRTGDVSVCLVILLLAAFILAPLSSPWLMSSSSTVQVILLLLVEGSVPRAAVHPRNSISILLGVLLPSSTIIPLIP